MSEKYPNLFQSPEFSQAHAFRSGDVVLAWIGADHAIPWPGPAIPGCAFLSFYGQGNQATPEFNLPGDASLRMVVESGPFRLQVVRSDGSAVDPSNAVPAGGMALGGIAEAGRYHLEIQSIGRWALTVAFFSPPTPV